MNADQYKEEALERGAPDIPPLERWAVLNEEWDTIVDGLGEVDFEQRHFEVARTLAAVSAELRELENILMRNAKEDDGHSPGPERPGVV